VTVLCGQWWGGDGDAFEHDGIQYRRVVSAPQPAAFAARLPFVLRAINPDLIHVVNSPPSGAVAAGVAGRLLRTPTVVDWWADRKEDSSPVARCAARVADTLITPSENIKTEIREYGVDAGGITVIPESIDFSLVENTPVDDRFDIVYSQRLNRHANVRAFFLGLAELRSRDWRAAVIGDGPERNRAERTAADLRIDDRVSFLGDISITDRVAILKGAHVAAQTARREPFAVQLLWGLAAGCVGIVEYQVDSAAHELVEGRDRASLVTSPAEFAAEIEAAGSLQHQTIDEQYTEYDHQSVLDRYLTVYDHAADGS
jgi:Glycosyltransferase